MVTTEELRDRAELRDLVEGYARGADTRDGEVYAGVFTDDAVLHTNRGEIRGREALLKVPAMLGRYVVTMHFVGNHHVTFAGADRATGETYCVARHVYEEGEAQRVYLMMIRYDDRYVRRNGAWKIAERTLNLLWDEDHPVRS